MATILAWPKHRIVSHGDLGGCSVCGSWEGEVPTECPGVEMTDEQRQAVMDGKLDYFRREGWSTVTHMQRLRVKLWCEEGRII